MSVLFDTSVLVAAMVENHERHDDSLPWLQRAQEGAFAGRISAHSLAETYAVLTAMPLPIRLRSDVAWQLIDANVLAHFDVVELARGDYRTLLDAAAKHDLRGGVIYDAIIARAAEKIDADQLLTLNPDDFRRVWPAGADRVITPDHR